MKSSKIWIGTSGWTHDGWRGPFYPEGMPKKDWRFATAEINGRSTRASSSDASGSRASLLAKRTYCLGTSSHKTCFATSKVR